MVKQLSYAQRAKVEVMVINYRRGMRRVFKVDDGLLEAWCSRYRVITESNLLKQKRG